MILSGPTLTGVMCTMAVGSTNKQGCSCVSHAALHHLALYVTLHLCQVDCSMFASRPVKATNHLMFYTCISLPGTTENRTIAVTGGATA